MTDPASTVLRRLVMPVYLPVIAGTLGLALLVPVLPLYLTDSGLSLRAASVVVEELDDNPGFFRVKTMLQPHFQVEGIDISISLVGKMPKK